MGSRGEGVEVEGAGAGSGGVVLGKVCLDAGSASELKLLKESVELVELLRECGMVNAATASSLS